MPLQANNLLDVGAQVLALNHALQSLIRSLPPGQKADFVKSLAAWAPQGITKAYADVISDMNHAAR